MSYVNRTLSYLKRNGLRDTLWAIAERKDQSGMDVWQRRTLKYDHAVKRSSFFGEVKPLPEEHRPGDGECKPFTKPVLTTEEEPVCFSILVPAYKTKQAYFKEMIESVRGQSYQNWQLVIADTSDTDLLGEIAESYEDPRITYVYVELNEGISKNTNEAFKYAYGDYVGFLDHDDLLAPDALYEVARALKEEDYDVVYTDEDKVSSDLSAKFEPNMKPGFNLDLLLTNNYICHFTVVRTKFFEKTLLRSEYDGAQDYDLMLRLLLGIEWLRSGGREGEFGLFPADYLKSKIGHVPRILYHWRAHEASTADNPQSKRYAYEAGKRAVEDFCKQLDWSVTVSHMKHLGFYRIEYHPDIFSVREDVWGLCGRKIKNGRVTAGPELDGVSLFTGMNYHYSGYLHRAALMLDVDKAPKELIRVPKGRRKLTPEERASKRLVYAPGLLLKEKK
ncbi:MAG: glycosyltransferase [Lachnospiraceae bacterium]|nr:glycosyltransferase [Lachnospiraceae bacterium]